jgi:hypothetical protein
MHVTFPRTRLPKGAVGLMMTFELPLRRFPTTNKVTVFDFRFLCGPLFQSCNELRVRTRLYLIEEANHL